MQRYVLEVMYDGAKFHGSQVQGTQVTVQFALNRALTTIFRGPIATYGASRTDEGVHALCNYYHVDIDVQVNFDLLYRMNAILPQGVAVKRIYTADHDFNVRFDAISRQYRYRIYAHKDPFLHERALFFPLPINEEVLHETAAIIKEYTHFESFCKRNAQSHTHTCTIMESYWQREGNELQYIVRANRFLRGMVRGLVGTQLQVARGKMTVDGFRKVIEANDCTKAFFDVSGNGLYLEEITFKDGVLAPLVFKK